MFPDLHRLMGAIGLPARDQDALEKRAIELAPFGEYEARDDGGSRIVWRDASGAGLSILSDAAHVLECVVPFFAVPPRARARVLQIVQDPAGPFTDRVVADVLDLHSRPVFRTAMLVHDLASARPRIVFDRGMELGLSAFVERLSIASPSALPSVSPHPSVLDRPGLPEPWIDLAARVLGTETRINRSSGVPFLHLRLDLGGFPMDAVAEVDALRAEPQGLARGTMIAARALLVGALDPTRHDTTIPRLPGSR